MSVAVLNNGVSEQSVISHQSVNLFSDVVRDCRIVRVTVDDARTESDSWSDLASLILGCEDQYPRIDRWLSEKVRVGVQAGRRHVFVGYHLGKPSVAAIVKTGASAKLCHLSVTPELRGRNVGELFFVLMAMSVRDQSRTMRFTLPEGLWEREREFFESFAFTEVQVAAKQYRRSERELFCEAPFAKVLPQALQKLSKLRQAISLDGSGWAQDLVLSVRPEFAERILAGTKSVEVRRSFSVDRAPASCLIYSTTPVQAVVGTVDVVRATRLTPQEVWSRFGTRVHCTWDELSSYSAGVAKVWALELANPHRHRNPVGLSFLRSCSPLPIRPPQSYNVVSSGSGWASAMPVVAMLQTACWPR
jgi:predicted transcriptional regulator